MATLYMTVGDDVFPSYVGDKDIYLSDFLKTYTLKYKNPLVIKRDKKLGLNLKLDGSINLFEMIEIEKLIKSSFTI